MTEDGKEIAKRVDDVEIQGPLGWRVKFPARSLTSTVVVIAAVAFLAYMIRDHDLRQVEQSQEIAKQVAVTAAKVAENVAIQVKEAQKIQKEGNDEVLYILLKSQNERSQIKLDMPQSLRTKLLSQERAR